MMKPIVRKHFQVILLFLVLVIIFGTGNNNDVMKVERHDAADDSEAGNGANCSMVVLWRLLENDGMLQKGNRGRAVERRFGKRVLRKGKDTGMLWNCTEYDQQEQLSITSITALCHAQCTASCEDLHVDCEDSNCTIYESAEWASQCAPDDYECLESCSQNETDSLDEMYLYNPMKPTSLALEQVTALKVRISWTPSVSSSADDTVIYVTEGTVPFAAEWTIISQDDEPWAEMEVDVCTVMAFRVASVNKYGSNGYTFPIFRTDLPAPDQIIDADKESIKLNEGYFHYEFKFFVPTDWKIAEPVADYGSGKKCNNILIPPAPFPGEFLTMDSNSYVYRTAVHESGFSCTYVLNIYLVSPCGVQGVPYTTYINLTDCSKIQGMQCPEPGLPGSEVEAGTTISSSSVTTTGHETQPLTSDASAGSSSSVVYISVASSIAAVVTAGLLLIVGCFVRRKVLKRRSKKRPTNVELPPLQLQKPLHQLKVENILYKSQENYTDIIGRDAWEIAWDCLVLGEVLGEGAFGQVRKGVIQGTDVYDRTLCSLAHDSHHQSNQMTVAVKMLTGDQIDIYRQDFLREMELMKSIGYHSNVVSMIGCCTKQNPLCLVVEHVALGDLQHYLQDYRSRCQQADGSLQFEYLTVHDLMYFAQQISVGMEFLSQKGFVHRDLAARNVLIGHEKKVKIGDFGLTRYIYDDQVYVTNRGGKLPLKWMAIESIFDLTFTTASDVWSFGVVLYELVTLGGTPYPTISNKDLLRELLRGYRMERPDNCSPEIYRLMIDCWQAGPSRRPTFTRLNSRITAIMDAPSSAQLALPTVGLSYENAYKADSSNSLTHVPCNVLTSSLNETPVITDVFDSDFKNQTNLSQTISMPTVAQSSIEIDTRKSSE